MKIDIFSHIFTKKYTKTLYKKASGSLGHIDTFKLHTGCIPLVDIEERFRLMDLNPDVLQVLTVAGPPLELLVSKQESVELAKIANDEMAELLIKYPDKFVTAAACLPLNNIDAAVNEIDRAITQLKFKGVQIFTNINGQPLDDIKFRPLFNEIDRHSLIVWLHCWDSPIMGALTSSASKRIQEWVKDPYRGMIGWDFETSLAMIRLVMSGIMSDYPSMKIITHHCGGMIPVNHMRIEELIGNQIRDMHKFYGDTVLHGNTAGLMCGYEFFGKDHILFGTDFPLGLRSTQRIPEAIQSVEKMKIPLACKRHIFEDNAKQLLNLTY